jgi:acetyl-CoA carboxylase biotin carboxyl carrier protein
VKHGADTEFITAPLVGTFYRAPAPDAPPFVEKGDTVKKGKPLCILEAMKLMNEYQAEFDLEIVAILVDNGNMVEFGAPLFEVRRV